MPLETERQDMREQWLRRLLKNTLLDCALIMEPFARQELAEAGNRGQTILRSLDQTELGNRMALLMLSLRIVKVIGGMKSLTVVKHLDIFKYILLSLSSGLIALMMNPFCFQGMKEAF